MTRQLVLNDELTYKISYSGSLVIGFEEDYEEFFLEIAFFNYK